MVNVVQNKYIYKNQAAINSALIWVHEKELGGKENVSRCWSLKSACAPLRSPDKEPSVVQLS